MMRNWKFWLSIGISALFLFLAFRKVNLSVLIGALEGANYIYLIPVVILTLLSFVFRAMRWWYFLEPIKKIKFHSLFSATMIGFMANNLLPARLGEFVRAYVIGEKEHISKSSSFASIVVERVFDGFTLLFFLAIVLVFFSLPKWLKTSGAVTGAIFVCALVVLIVMAKYTNHVLRFAGFLLKPFPKGFQKKLLGLLNSFTDGLKVFHNVKNVIIASVFSLLVWLPAIIVIYLLFLSFGMHLPASASLVLLSVLSIGVMIPAAPGYVGTIQLLCVVTLSLFAISKERALSFSIIYNASTFIPVTVVGLIYLFAEEFSFAQIRDSAKLKKTGSI